MYFIYLEIVMQMTVFINVWCQLTNCAMYCSHTPFCHRLNHLQKIKRKSVMLNRTKKRWWFKKPENFVWNRLNQFPITGKFKSLKFPHINTILRGNFSAFAVATDLWTFVLWEEILIDETVKSGHLFIKREIESQYFCNNLILI